MIKRKDKSVQVDSKTETVKQLQAECRKRKIGFMMNWTKAALVKRLEDEDNREKFYEQQMANKEKEIDKIAVELSQVHSLHEGDAERRKNRRMVQENKMKDRIKDAKANLEAEKINETDIKEKIEKLLSQKVSLSHQRKASINKIKELEAIIKSLI